MADDAEYDELFRAHYTRVVALAARITADPETGRDVAQDAFCELLRRWPTIAGYERPEAWVQRVAIRDAVRRAKRAARGRELERLSAPSALREDVTADPDVAAAIRSLPPMQRAAIVLRYFADLPSEAIADALGCREATVRVHLHRARQTLAARLGVTDGDEVTELSTGGRDADA